jgi:hypothetical protein
MTNVYQQERIEERESEFKVSLGLLAKWYYTVTENQLTKEELEILKKDTSEFLWKVKV